MDFGRIERLISSTKAQVALIAAVGSCLTLFNVSAENQVKALAAVGSMVTLAGMVIAGIAYEDGQTKQTDSTALPGQLLQSNPTPPVSIHINSTGVEPAGPAAPSTSEPPNPPT